MHILYSILLMILGVSTLVIVHESGHYFVARAFGMRVLKFSIGFGKPIIEWRPKNSPTTFQIGLIPVLAYVQIDGMNPAEEIDPHDPGLFPNKGVFARIATIAAGPLANYLLASLIVLCVAPIGWPSVEQMSPVTVDSVSAAYPAARAGILPGDVIVSANGQAINTFDDLLSVTKSRANQPTAYVVSRKGTQLPPITITPKLEGGRGIIGLTPAGEVKFKPLSLKESAKQAVIVPFLISADMLSHVGGMLQKHTTEGLSGPVGVGTVLYKQANKGILDFLITLLSLSVSLGLFNLFPIPALDGGRLMFLAYEVITRRRPNEQFEAVVHGVGLMMLLGLIAYVTIFRDVAGHG